MKLANTPAYLRHGKSSAKLKRHIADAPVVLIEPANLL
jgi:hypothetical protein